MTSKQNNQEQTTSLSARSAFKTLEIVLYQLSHHLHQPLQILFGKSDSFDNDTRLQIASIKETLSNLEFLLRSTLKERSHIASGDFTRADDQLMEKVQVDTILRALASSTSIVDHVEFYKFCVKTMAELYGCRYAFIGCLKEDGQHVQTQAVWAGDEFAENFEYSLEGTPCQDILTFNKELIPTGARELYPTDELLVHMGIDSYFGAPILNKEKGVIGLISVMDTKPMQPTEWTAPILGVFAARLALEIERKQAMDELSALNNTLEERIKERTKALEIVNDELKSFSYSVSHDLRAPIRAVTSFTDILTEDYGHELSDDAMAIVTRIKNAGLRLENITVELLRLSKISSSELTIQKVDLSALVNNILYTLTEQEPQREVDLKVQPGLSIWADEKLLRIALENLLGNAWKYTRKNDITRISFGKTTDDAVDAYYIKDNGVGFDETFINKLFIPFERLHSDTEFEGNGIGLATTLRAISRHRGDVWAKSSPGNGACFYFMLGSDKPIIEKT